MRRIIISGSTSMLGVALIKECIKHKTRVYALIKPNSIHRTRLPISELVEPIECDLSELLKLKDLVTDRDFDAFYHFGWQATSKDGRYNPDLQNKNIDYTLDAVGVAKIMGCKAFIGAGSQAEYGRSNEKLSPESPCHPETAYGIAKYAAGKLSSIKCDCEGIKYIWARIFSVYGENDNDGTMIRHVIEKLLSGESPSLTKCEQTWDYLYCEDAARAFYLLGEKGKDQQVYCIGSGEAKTLLDYINIIKDSINKDLPLGIGQLPYSDKQIMYLCADITKLRDDTGFNVRMPFEEGIKRTIKWSIDHDR